MKYAAASIGVGILTILLFIAYQVSAAADEAALDDQVRVHRSDGFVCFYTSRQMEYVSIPPWQLGPIN